MEKHDRTWKNWSHPEKRITLGKKGQTWMKWVKLRNWVKLGKKDHTWKKGITLGKKDHSWKHRHGKRVRVIFCNRSIRRTVYSNDLVKSRARNKEGSYDVHSALHR